MKSEAPQVCLGAPIRRVALHEHVTEALRSGISSGRWQTCLPSEAELCRELQVSRMTLRASLQVLANDDWLKLGGRGRRHQISTTSGLPSRPSGKIVRLLTPYPLFSMGSNHLVLLESMRECLARSGHSLEIEIHPKLFGETPGPALERLDQLPDTAGWVLIAAPPPMQRWFAARRRPCMVLGPLGEGVELPCAYPDTEASARHAVGLLTARGHQVLAYLIREFTTQGDQRGSTAFLAAAKRAGVQARLITHTEDPANLRHVVTQKLLGNPRPTGFFTNCAEDALTLLGHLQASGLHVPRDASVIAGWADMFLKYSVPTIAHYRIDGEKLGRKAARHLLDLLRGESIRLRNFPLIPEFVSGESLR